MITNKVTVYYVDDDREDREFFQLVADELNMEYQLFTGVDELLDHLGTHPTKPDIIFTDLHMPIKNGCDLMKEIMSFDNFKDVPIVFLSSTVEKVHVEMCYGIGAALYLSKTHDINQFRQNMKQVVNIDWKNFHRNKNNFVL